jgi:hypothetical protein
MPTGQVKLNYLGEIQWLHGKGSPMTRQRTRSMRDKSRTRSSFSGRFRIMTTVNRIVMGVGVMPEKIGSGRIRGAEKAAKFRQLPRLTKIGGSSFML